MKRLARVLVVGTMAVVLLGGCGGGGGDEGGATQQPTAEAQSTEESYTGLQVNIAGKAGPEDAGLLLARKLGYFPASDLRVWFVTPSHPARLPMYVEDELVDAAAAHGPQLILAREQGMPLVAIGSLIPHPTMAMIWLEDSGIKSVADLRGKTIAIPGVRFQRLFLEAVLNRAGLTLADVELKSVSYFLEDELATGRADAIFGGSANNEGKLLEERGLEPVVTPVAKLGVPDYDELVLIARRDRYAEDPDTFQRLAEAMTRGGATVIDRPGAASKAIVHYREYENSATPEFPLHPKATRAGVEEMAPRFPQTGRIDEAKLERLVDWMYKEEMIKRRWTVSQLLGASAADRP